MSPAKRVGSPEELMAGEIGLMPADTKTGVTTDNEGHWLVATPVSYLVFPSMELASEYARKRVEDTPDIEWMFYDLDGYLSTIRAAAPQPPAPPGRVPRLWAAIKRVVGAS